jgi:hypothetical protein
MYIYNKGYVMDKTGFFEEAPGVKSSMRLIVFIGIMWALSLGTYEAVKMGTDLMTVAGFVGSMVTLFIGGKLIQGSTQEKQ